jgi:predicted nucleic acid-binding protein
VKDCWNRSLPIDTQDETDRLRGPVLRLARAYRLSVYDAVYLDLAMDRALPLATRDVALRKAALAEGVSLIEP